jgi:hypothetical protein
MPQGIFHGRHSPQKGRCLAMPAHYVSHQIGQRAYVRVKGLPERWFLAELTSTKPLHAKIIEPDPVWFGSVVTHSNASIRVDPRHWPQNVKGTPCVS